MQFKKSHGKKNLKYTSNHISVNELISLIYRLLLLFLKTPHPVHKGTQNKTPKVGGGRWKKIYKSE